MEIRDLQLYLLVAPTFSEYVENRWRISRSTAYEWLEAAAVVRKFGQSEIEPPQRISHALLLANLPAEEAQQVIKRARELTNGAPTASAIREAISGKATREDVPHDTQQLHYAHILRMARKLDTEHLIKLVKELDTWV